MVCILFLTIALSPSVTSASPSCVVSRFHRFLKEQIYSEPRVTLTDRDVELLKAARLVRAAPTSKMESVYAGGESIQLALPPSEIKVGLKSFQVKERLGVGGDGEVFRAIDEEGKPVAIKRYYLPLSRRKGDLSAHEQLVRAHKSGVPTIIDSKMEWDSVTGVARYRYVEGLDVDYIYERANVPIELKAKIEEGFQKWRKIYCGGEFPAIFICWEHNVVFEFETGLFFLIDAF